MMVQKSVAIQKIKRRTVGPAAKASCPDLCCQTMSCGCVQLLVELQAMQR